METLNENTSLIDWLGRTRTQEEIIERNRLRMDVLFYVFTFFYILSLGIFPVLIGLSEKNQPLYIASIIMTCITWVPITIYLSYFSITYTCLLCYKML